MTLPTDKNIDSKILSQIFNNTVATYKYYWFISILDLVVKEKKRSMSFSEIIVGMIAEAWYPIHYFRLSFGKSDSLYSQIFELQKELNLAIDANKIDIKRRINNNLNIAKVRNLLRVFTLNVPYRFLSPWITYTSDSEVAKISQSLFKNCIYSINGDSIEINPSWEQYLNENYLILRDFTYWNLTIFLQKRNPNVPDVPSKLIKPIFRDSLSKQRNYWNNFIDLNGPIKCIYTGNELHRNSYDLDHFLPWSFVSHNLLWNLIPADSSVNSSKSNALPNLNEYLQPFAQLHQKSLQTLYWQNPNNRIFEDYLVLHISLSDFVNLSDYDFYEVFQKTFNPLAQIAENMGFQYWLKK